jgi:hypothetical protein
MMQSAAVLAQVNSPKTLARQRQEGSSGHRFILPSLTSIETSSNICATFLSLI